MADAFVSGLNRIAADWACAMGRGTWQGLILLAAVWAVCKLVPRMPATVRYWLWWLVCAKFLVGCLFVPSIRVSILPPAAASAHRLARRIPAVLIETDGLTSVHSRPAAAKLTPAADPTGQASSVSAEMPERTIVRRPGSPSRSGEIRPAARLSIASALMAIWAGIVAVLLSTAVKRSMRISGILRRSNPAGDAFHDEFEGRPVRAVVSTEVDGICVTGVFRPVIVISAMWASAELSVERRMAIAHELAHLKRRDLWLDLVPAAASIAFFFLPLVRIASAACALAREEACDLAAIRATSSRAVDYAAMLLKAAGAGSTAGALGISPAYRQLRARLAGLAAAAGPTPLALRALSAGIAAVVLAALAPWRPTARAESPKQFQQTRAAKRWELIDLGPVSGDDATHFRINDAGQVIGTSNGRPFLWQNGSISPLKTLWFPSGRGGDIDNRGGYTVTCYSDAGNPHAFYERGPEPSGVTRIKGLPGYRFTVARGIGENGWIVGSAEHSGSDPLGAEISRAIVWMDGHTVDLGTLGGSHSAAYAVNEEGQIVGKADLAPSTGGATSTHAFLWQSGDMRDLGTLGGSHSFAYAVNNEGTVAGFSLTPGDTDRHACLWRTVGAGAPTTIDLGALPGDSASEAHGVNDLGQVVGTSDVAPDAASNHAVLWDATGADTRPVDLNRIVDTHGNWRLTDAMAINNAGVIVGKGLFQGSAHAFVLKPIPTHAPDSRVHSLGNR